MNAMIEAPNAAMAIHKAIRILNEEGGGLLLLCYKAGEEFRWIRVISLSDEVNTDSAEYEFIQNRFAKGGDFIEDALWNPSEEMVRMLACDPICSLKFKSLHGNILSMLYVPPCTIHCVIAEYFGRQRVWVKRGTQCMDPEDIGNDRGKVRIPDTTRNVVGDVLSKEEMELLHTDLGEGYVIMGNTSEATRIMLDEGDCITEGLLGDITDAKAESDLIPVMPNRLSEIQLKLNVNWPYVNKPTAQEILMMVEMLDSKFPKGVDRSGLTYDADWCANDKVDGAPTDVTTSVHVILTCYEGLWYIENMVEAPMNADKHIFTCIFMTETMAESFVIPYLSF